MEKQQKAILRAQRLELRDAMPSDERHRKSLAIAAAGILDLRFEPSTIISAFMPIRSEVDLRPLMQLLHEKGARLCLPVILDRKTIAFREYAPDMELVKSGFGTSGPPERAPILDPDMLLIPLSAFDRHGHRIGYGAGHYDRAIERLHRKGRDPALIGIAFDCQEVASVPAEPHDVGLNAILTESGYRAFDRQIG